MHPNSCQHAVTLQPSGWRFQAAADRALLASAALASIRLPSSCRNGTCRACMCRLEAGDVVYPDGVRPGLSRDERDEGWVLPCMARPASSLVLRVPGAAPLEKRPPPQGLTGARR